VKVALGADHAGFALKAEIARYLTGREIPFEDFGTTSAESVDYPDFAIEVAMRVAAGAFDVGILICGTGVGMAIAANKVHGIRAASICDVETARLSREHNNANVLTLGARVTPTDRALAIVATFLETPFAGGRHIRRIEKITQLETRND
jgi:ribose 5-phosphate isomerase B